MRVTCLVAVWSIFLLPAAHGSPVVHTLVREARSKGPLPIERAGMWGYIDHAGKITIPTTFDSARCFYEGLAAVEVKGKWGFIDINGKSIIPTRFTSVQDFSDGMAGVFIDSSAVNQGLYGYIDVKGQIVVKCSAACGRPYNEGKMADAVEVFRCEDSSGKITQQEYPCVGAHAVQVDRWGYYDKSGKLAFSSLFKAGLGRFAEGLAAVQPDGAGKMGYIDGNANMTIAYQFDRAEAFSEGLAAVRLGDKWGFIDHQGKVVIPPQFESVSHFSDGYAMITLFEKAGYVDSTGHITIPPQYSDATPFSEGLAAVCCVGGSTGYIDKNGSFVIPVRYPGARVGGPFSEGVALVFMNGGGAYIDRSGKVIALVNGKR